MNTPTPKQPDFIVEKATYDAARPYAVVATFRSFNRVIARYATKAAAQRKAALAQQRFTQGDK